MSQSVKPVTSRLARFWHGTVTDCHTPMCMHLELCNMLPQNAIHCKDSTPTVLQQTALRMKRLLEEIGLGSGLGLPMCQFQCVVNMSLVHGWECPRQSAGSAQHAQRHCICRAGTAARRKPRVEVGMATMRLRRAANSVGTFSGTAICSPARYEPF